MKSDFQRLHEYDRENGQIIAGFDEVGRGSLAGPIVGACVIYDTEAVAEYADALAWVRDSKKLPKTRMEETADAIKDACLHYEIFYFDPFDIDRYGIGKCNEGLVQQSVAFANRHGADILLADGNLPVGGCLSVIKGDNTSLAIASASIVAKNYRDTLMKALDINPEYGFLTNVGYGSKQHIGAIKQYGLTPHHRRSFCKGLI